MKRYIRASQNDVKIITSISELRDELESGKYNYYGLRGVHESDMNYISRGYLEPSWVWDRSDWTDERLNGTCALYVDEYMSDAELESRYFRALNDYSPIGVVLLIADKVSEWGADENEIILGNGYGADVVAKVEIKGK